MDKLEKLQLIYYVAIFINVIWMAYNLRWNLSLRKWYKRNWDFAFQNEAFAKANLENANRIAELFHEYETQGDSHQSQFPHPLNVKH